MKTLASTILAISIAIPAAAEAGSLRVGAELVLSPDGRHTDDAPGFDTVTHDLGVAYALNVASSAANQSKADKDPAEWLPARRRHSPWFVALALFPEPAKLADPFVRAIRRL